MESGSFFLIHVFFWLAVLFPVIYSLSREGGRVRLMFLSQMTQYQNMRSLSHYLLLSHLVQVLLIFLVKKANRKERQKHIPLQEFELTCRVSFSTQQRHIRYQR